MTVPPSPLPAYPLRSIQNRPVEESVDDVLHVGVERNESVVESRGRAVDPAEKPIVHCTLHSRDAGVDLGRVCSGLVVHACIDGCRDRVRKIC